MTFFRSGSRQSEQRGFAIMELLVYVAIIGIIGAAVTFAVVHMLRVNASSTNRITAVRQVQNAGYRISQDAQQAQAVLYDDTNTPELDEFLILSWTEWGGTGHLIVYIFDEDNDEIIRYHYQDDVLVDETIVARFISNATFDIDADSERVNLIVTATVGGFQRVSETRVYEIIPRAEL